MVFFDSDDLIDIAEYYHISGELDKAEAAADYCLELHPTESSPLLFKARMALVDYGDVARAKSLLSQVKEEVESLEAVYVTAEVMLSDGGAAKAESYLCEKYEKYMETRPSEGFSDDMDEDEDEPDFALDVAMMYCDHGYTDYAERWMKKAIVPENGASTEYYDTWARIYLDQKRWEEAVGVINKVIDADAYNVVAWLMMSDAQFQMAQYYEALQSAEYAIAISPGEPEPYLSKGNSLYALNRLDEARSSFERYVELCPDDPAGELLLATTLLYQYKLEEAYEHVKIVLEHLDDFPPTQVREALRTCAIIAAKSGDETLAMKCCDRMEETEVGEGEADLLRGAVCMEQYEVQRALAFFNKAAESSGYDLKTLAHIGVICHEAGLFSMAYTILKEVVKQHEADGYKSCPPQYLAFLTGACYSLAKREEYMYYLKYAVELAPLDISSVLGEHFPPGTEPRDYLDIELGNKRQNK